MKNQKLKTLLVSTDNMKPFIKKGDMIYYEDIKPRLVSSVYLIKENNITYPCRVQTLVNGDIRLILDADKENSRRIKKEDMHNIIFIGHVVDRVTSTNQGYEIKRGYRLYS